MVTRNRESPCFTLMVEGLWRLTRLFRKWNRLEMDSEQVGVRYVASSKHATVRDVSGMSFGDGLKAVKVKCVKVKILFKDVFRDGFQERMNFGKM